MTTSATQVHGDSADHHAARTGYLQALCHLCQSVPSLFPLACFLLVDNGLEVDRVQQHLSGVQATEALVDTLVQSTEVHRRPFIAHAAYQTDLPHAILSSLIQTCRRVGASNAAP